MKLILLSLLAVSLYAQSRVTFNPFPPGSGLQLTPAGGGGNTTICNGSASATVATCPGVPAPTTYGLGTAASPYLSGTFIPGATSSGAPLTLEIAGLGAKNVFVGGVATSATNTVTSGIPYFFQYDGTQIQVLSGGGGAIATQIAAFSVCGSAGCVLNETANWTYAVMVAGTIKSCGVVATVAPTGSTIIVDILLNGTSIFGGNPKTTVAISSTSYAAVSTFASAAVVVGDKLTAKVTQVDSNSVGQFVRAGCTIQ